MKNKFIRIGQVARLIAALLLSSTLLIGLVQITQAAPPPPKPPGGSRCGSTTCAASANLTFKDLDKVFDPKIGTPGKTITMTLRAGTEPYKEQLTATDAFMEIPLYGEQKLVSFDPLKTNWTLRDSNARTLLIDIGRMTPGQEGTIQIVTTVPTDLNRPIMEMNLLLNWNDATGSKRKGWNVLLPLNVPLPGPVVLPDVPSGSSSKMPTTGPFAAQPVPPADQYNSIESWYIPATHHNLSGDFLTYWLEHGSVLVLGYPISEKFQEQESGLVIQYFERGILEAHPENGEPYNVLLKSLGRESDKATEAITPDNAPAPGSVFYPETGHWMDGRFVDYWSKNGGLAQFGFPIAEPTIEGNKLVQWTERARFELDISSAFTPLVQLGLVGNEFAQIKGYLPK